MVWWGDPSAAPPGTPELSLPAPASCSLTRGGADGVEVLSGSSCISPAGGVAAGAEPQPGVVVPRWAALGTPSSHKVGSARRFIYILFSSFRLVSRGGPMSRLAQDHAMCVLLQAELTDEPQG